MFKYRASEERGTAEIGWLSAKHSFSFGEYYDPNHVQFRSLRVINEDRIQPKAGFPTHGHKDMEILTYVISGALEHKDSMGNGSIIRPGELQYMSAGSGVRHSEFNHSSEDVTHLLQIWILPNQTGLEPAYDQISFDQQEAQNKLRLVAQNADENAAAHPFRVISVRQDIKLYVAHLEANREIEYSVSRGRGLWIQIVKGALNVQSRQSNQALKSGDGLAVEDLDSVLLQASDQCEFLLFDLS